MDGDRALAARWLNFSTGSPGEGWDAGVDLYRHCFRYWIKEDGRACLAEFRRRAGYPREVAEGFVSEVCLSSSFLALQFWAPEDRRARPVAALFLKPSGLDCPRFCAPQVVLPCAADADEGEVYRALARVIGEDPVPWASLRSWCEEQVVEETRDPEDGPAMYDLLDGLHWPS